MIVWQNFTRRWEWLCGGHISSWQAVLALWGNNKMVLCYSLSPKIVIFLKCWISCISKTLIRVTVILAMKFESASRQNVTAGHHDWLMDADYGTYCLSSAGYVVWIFLTSLWPFHPKTRLTLASILGPFGVHLLKFTLPTPVHWCTIWGLLEFPVRICDAWSPHITTQTRCT